MRNPSRDDLEFVQDILCLREALPASLLEQWQAECSSVERAELETWLAELPDGALLVDTWEQPIPRPEDPAVQESYYSGKQKEHTRKNQLICDKAYVGRANTTTPIKKKPKGALTEAQKAFNKGVSQQRVYVEHLIRVIKIFRIGKELFRMRLPMYETVIGCVCGLVRLRVQYV